MMYVRIIVPFSVDEIDGVPGRRHFLEGETLSVSDAFGTLIIEKTLAVKAKRKPVFDEPTPPSE